MASGDFKNAVGISKLFIENYVQAGSSVLDCTVGNGKDTKLMAEKVGPEGLVYGFDIQLDAINITRNLLKKYDLEARVKLINENHIYIDKYIEEELDFIIYNLGYLPGGDKKIITQADTSMLSIKKSLNLLKRGGYLLIISYIGHPGGLVEKDEIKDLLQSLEQTEFTVIESQFINQSNRPPILYLVERAV